VLDSGLRLSPKSRIVAGANDDLLVFTAASAKSPKTRALRKAGVEVVHFKPGGRAANLQRVLIELGKREILSVLLEAGPILNGAALAAAIVSKFVLFYAPKLAGETGVPFAKLPKGKIPLLRINCIRQFGPDVAVEYVRRNS
jgi:diaminohydroxyphosphoribosylaminopyrimidine deaminase/5-amino-6-(5-phosphoribosylamino)uracil reductase